MSNIAKLSDHELELPRLDENFLQEKSSDSHLEIWDQLNMEPIKFDLIHVFANWQKI